MYFFSARSSSKYYLLHLFLFEIWHFKSFLCFFLVYIYPKTECFVLLIENYAIKTTTIFQWKNLQDW